MSVRGIAGGGARPPEPTPPQQPQIVYQAVRTSQIVAGVFWGIILSSIVIGIFWGVIVTLISS